MVIMVMGAGWGAVVFVSVFVSVVVWGSPTMMPRARDMWRSEGEHEGGARGRRNGNQTPGRRGRMKMPARPVPTYLPTTCLPRALGVELCAPGRQRHAASNR